jgi:MFS family permease
MMKKNISQKRVYITTIAAQCLGAAGKQSFINGLLLAFLLEMEFSETVSIILVALPHFMVMAVVPFSLLSDRMGKIPVAVIGNILEACSFLLLGASPFFPAEIFHIIITAAIFVNAIGHTMGISNWFSLLKPIIPEAVVGRYFGILRISWQSVSLFIGLVFSRLLAIQSDLPMYRMIFFSIALLSAARIFFILLIPDVEQRRTTPHRESLFTRIGQVLHHPGFISFASYVFLLIIAIGSVPGLLGMLSKQSLQFSASRVVLLGNLFAAGNIAGFFLGGILVDRLGTRLVFLITHLFFGLGLFGVFLRGIPFLSAFTVMISVNLLLGAVKASQSIAMTSELFAILPRKNRNLATGMFMMVQMGAIGLSSILTGIILKVDVLKSEWTLFGYTFSRHDTLFAGYGIMIILLVITLGLIPSVIREPRTIPSA